MPLYVKLEINENPIDGLKISRLKRLKSHDAVYPYVVEAEDGREAHFEHTYSDGGLVCVEKALVALRERGV